jgi:Peptidase M61 N-terminal domain
MLYPAGVPVRQIVVVPSVIVPSGWGLGTALTPTKSSGETTTFAQTTIAQLEDSPSMRRLVGVNPFFCGWDKFISCLI